MSVKDVILDLLWDYVASATRSRNTEEVLKLMGLIRSIENA